MIRDHQDLLQQWYSGQHSIMWEFGPFSDSFDQDQLDIADAATDYAQRYALVDPSAEWRRQRAEDDAYDEEVMRDGLT